MVRVEKQGIHGEGKRFEFGKNWTRFLRNLNDERILEAERSLKGMLKMESLKDARFLDIGSGSGLSSLAAVRLGARVHSFDFDEECIACTAKLKQRYYPDKGEWTIEKGSVLDQDYLRALGKFDIVYSWGVLHHTGAMWEALDDVTIPVKEGGRLCVAIYNDQGYISSFWRAVKRMYNRVPRPLRPFVLVPSFVRIWGPTLVTDLLKHGEMRKWKRYSSERGMSAWYDVVDWVGGYPFEVAQPMEVADFLSRRGFILERMKTCGKGRGCNEFVFKKGD